MRIAIDIDSTLHPYWEHLAAFSRKRFGVDLPYDEQFVYGTTRLKQHQFDLCVQDTHCAESILKGTPFPGAVEAINRWKDAGHFIHVTSHRDCSAHDATAQWLAKIDLHYDELYCSADKVSRCREIHIDLLIDDAPDNLRRAVDSGIAAATLRHPWNEDVIEEEDVIAADDWPTLAAQLERRIPPLARAAAVA